VYKSCTQRPADSETPRRLPMQTMNYNGLDVHKRTITVRV
jgi:hypothetical protein